VPGLRLRHLVFHYTASTDAVERKDAEPGFPPLNDNSKFKLRGSRIGLYRLLPIDKSENAYIVIITRAQQLSHREAKLLRICAKSNNLDIIYTYIFVCTYVNLLAHLEGCLASHVARKDNPAMPLLASPRGTRHAGENRCLGPCDEGNKEGLSPPDRICLQVTW